MPTSIRQIALKVHKTVREGGGKCCTAQIGPEQLCRRLLVRQEAQAKTLSSRHAYAGQAFALTLSAHSAASMIARPWSSSSSETTSGARKRITLGWTPHLITRSPR